MFPIANSCFYVYTTTRKKNMSGSSCLGNAIRQRYSSTKVDDLQTKDKAFHISS